MAAVLLLLMIRVLPAPSANSVRCTLRFLAHTWCSFSHKLINP